PQDRQGAGPHHPAVAAAAGGSSHRMITRRRFVASCGAMLAAPLTTEAQQPVKVPRVGLLLTPSPEHPIAKAVLDAFHRGLRERGYVVGQTIIVEPRFAPERLERYR